MDPLALSTRRLRLVPPESADAEAVFRACQDPDIPRFVPVPHPYTRKHSIEFIQHCETAWANDAEVTWAIHDHDGLAGMIGLRILGMVGEIGFWVAASARGRGYATEAARAVVDHAFAPEGLSLRRIEWRARVGNVASARIAQLLGFQYEGLLRQAMTTPRGCFDAWIAAVLSEDDRTPQRWEIAI